MKREVKFRKAYDYRDEPGDGRGAGGVLIQFVLHLGSDEAMVATVATGWVPEPLAGVFIPGQRQQRRTNPGVDARLYDCYPSGSHISIHSRTQRKPWWVQSNECDALGGTCFNDAGYAVADDFLRILVADGDEAAWAYLESLHQEWVAAEDITEAAR